MLRHRPALEQTNLNFQWKERVEQVDLFYPYHLTNLEYHWNEQRVQIQMFAHHQVRSTNREYSPLEQVQFRQVVNYQGYSTSPGRCLFDRMVVNLQAHSANQEDYLPGWVQAQKIVGCQVCSTQREHHLVGRIQHRRFESHPARLANQGHHLKEFLYFEPNPKVDLPTYHPGWLTNQEYLLIVQRQAEAS